MGTKKTHQKLAVKAEDTVASLWQKRDWCILARNYRGIGFEIDLIMQKKDVISFIEVKARSYLENDSWTLEEFITPQKSAALRKGAQHFISARQPNADHYRFDLCLVIKEEKVVVVPNILVAD